MVDATPSPRRTRVLVADDTDSIRTLFQKLLTADGHEVISVEDGVEALDAIQQQRPDVILLDVGMPGLDGIEVCRRLKSDPATRLTPVVLVTGLSDLSDRIKGIEAGADDFLSKPVHPHELRARVVGEPQQKPRRIAPRGACRRPGIAPARHPTETGKDRDRRRCLHLSISKHEESSLSSSNVSCEAAMLASSAVTGRGRHTRPASAARSRGACSASPASATPRGAAKAARA